MIFKHLQPNRLPQLLRQPSQQQHLHQRHPNQQQRQHNQRQQRKQQQPLQQRQQQLVISIVKLYADSQC